MNLRHLTALKSAFAFAQASQLSWDAGAQQSYANEVRFVLDCIARGIPCGTDPAELVPFFLTTSWSGRGDPAALWRAYAQAGYIDPSVKVKMYAKHGPLRAHSQYGFVTLLPLEMAIAVEHEAGFQALLDSGARADGALSRQWKAAKKPMDLLGFIKHVIRNDAKRARFRAIAAKALGALPLELAVLNGDLRKFAARLKAGDSITQVPSRQWESGVRRPMDVMGFVKFACTDAQLREQFTAVATKALMDACIALGSSAPPATAPKMPQTPRKVARTPAQAAPALQVSPGFVDLGPSALVSGAAAVDSLPGPAVVDALVDHPTGLPMTPRMRRASI